MKTRIRINDTRQPALTRAVIRQLGGIEAANDSMPDIVRHGADGGFVGFTYYADTVKFTAKHKTDILERLKDDADSFGQGLLEMLKGFRCFNGLNENEIADGLYNPRSENRQTVFNGLAWYAAEEISRELNPDL